jgi:hypothetical protein
MAELKERSDLKVECALLKKKAVDHVAKLIELESSNALRGLFGTV